MRESNQQTADDENYNFMLYDFAMTHDIDSLRRGYQKLIEEQGKRQIDNELLRELGYSEEDIAKNITETE